MPDKKSSIIKKRRPYLKRLMLVLISPLIAWLIWQYAYIYPIAAQTCFSTTQVQSDSRCLYILQNHVFEKGTRSNPHKGNACGSDVTAYIPSFHFTNQYIKLDILTLDPNYRGEICVAPTNTPTPSPTHTPTPTPTNSPPTATPTTNPCVPTQVGDTNCDNKADLADFETWRREYLGLENGKLADFDKDGNVYLSDFEIWRKKYLNIAV